MRVSQLGVQTIADGPSLLSFLELDIFAPYPLPLNLPPAPSVKHIALGLELLPIKEKEQEEPDTFGDVSPMDELVCSIQKKAFPALEAVHLLSCEQTAIFEGRDAWPHLPKWSRHAASQGFDLVDGWGDSIDVVKLGWPEERSAKPVVRDERRTLVGVCPFLCFLKFD